MAFYTAEWVRKLIKQDEKEFLEIVRKDKNDFRTYIDRVLPFTLYLDLSVIEKDVLYPGAPGVEKLAGYVGLAPSNIRTLLLAGYKKLIKNYNSGKKYKTITRDDFDNLIGSLNTAVRDSSNLRSDLKAIFKNTSIIQSSSETYAILIFPNFNLVSANLGNDLRDAIKETQQYKALPEVSAEGTYFDSIKAKFDDFLENKSGSNKKLLAGTSLAEIQNIGHIEVDLISSQSNEVKRGLVSPRLLQALLVLPKSVKPQTLVRRFSKETLQADTRVIVRKKFTGTKLILEALVESGLMIGSLESRESNLKKSQLEKDFAVGGGLTKLLRDPKTARTILANLETSKSINIYLTEEIIRAITTGKVNSYSSSKTITSRVKTTRDKVSVPLEKGSKSNINTSTFKKIKVPVSSFTDLQTILERSIRDEVQRNMGKGSDTKVLNYRTGQFADSVKIERLSQSRAGMITVFYSYMKNPYATFSDGGRQQYPKSRDPKLLISKSIREIAAREAYNNLRAVNV